ncbi:GlsB/YeaQ/YmgE family stress response membrane protein [Dyadobacter endophyticus]|nr:GlsB/YeaQ/YmgE family stress response membrane protein [Dyadobacter endophyticus]
MTNLLISILIGAFAGWLADKLFTRFSLSSWLQLILGIVGGFVGGWLLGDDLQTVLKLPSLVSRVLTSFIGAAIVLGIAALIRRKDVS